MGMETGITPAENDFGRSLHWPVLVLKPLQPSSRPDQIDLVRKSKFGDRQDKPTNPPPDLGISNSTGVAGMNGSVTLAQQSTPGGFTRNLDGKGHTENKGLAKASQTRELLEDRVRLAQELLDARHARIKAAVLEVLGERPPDPEGIEYLRRLARDLDTAREALIDATCRWHYFISSRKRAQPV
jgi:hypothetical protein